MTQPGGANACLLALLWARLTLAGLGACASTSLKTTAAAAAVRTSAGNCGS